MHKLCIRYVFVCKVVQVSFKFVSLNLDPEATPKYFSRSLVGKSRSLFSLSELFRDSVHWTT